MEADRATSHVEFFAKACTAILEVRKNGRYRVKKNRERLQSRSLSAYYFGHVLKSNFFLLRGIETPYFPAAERLIRSLQDKGGRPNQQTSLYQLVGAPRPRPNPL